MGTVTVLRRPARMNMLAQLENVKQNYILGLAAVSLFSSEKSLPILEEASCTIGPYAISFSQVADTMKDAESKRLLLREFSKFMLRTLVRESFSVIHSYCVCNGYIARLERESWYEFVRIINNCLSRNFRFCFDERDLAVLPVVWRDKLVTADMQNQPLCLSMLSHADGWELFEEMDSFASHSLF